MPQILQAKLDEIHAALDVAHSDEEDLRLRRVLNQLHLVLHKTDHLVEWVEVEKLKPHFSGMDKQVLEMEECLGFQITPETKLARKKAIEDAETWDDCRELRNGFRARKRLLATAMNIDLEIGDDEVVSKGDVVEDNLGVSEGEQECPDDAMEVDEEQERMEEARTSLFERPLVLRAKL